MKLIAKFDDGTEVELKEIQGIDIKCDMLLIKTPRMLHEEDVLNIEERLSRKLKRNVVILDGEFGEVIGLKDYRE